MNDNQDKKEKAKDHYYNKGSKERSKEYYQTNKEVLKEKARIRYRELPEEQKELKRQYSRNRYKKLTEVYFLSRASIKISSQKIKFGDKEVDKKEFY